MIEQYARGALVDRREEFVTPAYDDYCLVNVPGTAGQVLDVDVGPSLPADALAGVDADVSHVVVVVLDGFGWHRWCRDRDDHRFLSRLAERGAVMPLTSVASSSTAPAITSVHTAATPAEHGVLGCDVYLPDRGAIVEPFPHEIRVDAGDGAATPSVEAERLIDATPAYPAFEAAGIDTRVVQPADTLGTEYADAALRGATQVPYDDPADGAETLRETLTSAGGQSYTYWYVPDLDAATHEYGPDSGAYHDALARITRHLSRALYDRVDAETAAETLLLVTADHGTIPFEPGPSDCLRVAEIDGVAADLRRAGDGPLPPFGDPRLCHLAVEPGRADDVAAAVEARGATAFTRAEVRETELFGPATDSTVDRCGDVVVADADRKLVYPGMEKVVSFAGIHGGLTPREMIVPFAAARLDRLQG